MKKGDNFVKAARLSDLRNGAMSEVGLEAHVPGSVVEVWERFVHRYPNDETLGERYLALYPDQGPPFTLVRGYDQEKRQPTLAISVEGVDYLVSEASCGGYQFPHNTGVCFNCLVTFGSGMGATLNLLFENGMQIVLSHLPSDTAIYIR